MENNNNWYDYIPISINDTYGDPFIIEQVDDTIMKINKLKNHKVPFVILTKAPYNPLVLEKLRKIEYNPMMVIMYSLTGLDEGGYSFDNRVKFILELKEIFGEVAILTRPIIKNRNDNVEMLSKIVGIAKKCGNYLVLGGLHDAYKNKQIRSDIENILIKLCDEAGVKSFYKSSCCAAYMKKTYCWMHDVGIPYNLEVIRKLGYVFEVVENQIVLDKATTGDLNFIKIITKSEVYCKELISNYNLLTINTGEKKFECTSSWFAWSRNIETCIDCDYCIIKQIEYLKKSRVEVGCHPKNIFNYIMKEESYLEKFNKFNRTMIKPQVQKGNLNNYKNFRTVKPCFAIRYGER